MKYPITLDALEVLDAIERKGSFAAAANELFRVPSAISYSIQKLEQDLDVVLFRKEGRKAVLTPAGKILLEQGREILQATERLAMTTKKTHIPTWSKPLAKESDMSIISICLSFDGRAKNLFTKPARIAVA